MFVEQRLLTIAVDFGFFEEELLYELILFNAHFPEMTEFRKCTVILLVVENLIKWSFLATNYALQCQIRIVYCNTFELVILDLFSVIYLSYSSSY